MRKTTKKRDHHHVISRWCEAYAVPADGLYAHSGVHVDTPRDPKNCTHSLRSDIDWDAIEAENARYAEELARHKAEEVAQSRPISNPKVRVTLRLWPAREPLEERSCVVCGKVFTPHNPKHIHCSQSCTKKAFRDKKRDERLASMEPRRCAYCGCMFEPTHGRQVFCTPKCQSRSQYKPTCYYNKCKTCGEEWTSNRPGHFCSERCRAKFNYVSRGRPRGRPKKAKNE